MILCTHAVEKYVGLIFTNYDIAYVGKRFSQSFMKWVNMFVQDILNAYNTKTSRYRGSVVSISSVFYYAPNGEIVMYITTISANPIQLAIVRGHTLSERISAGMTSPPPTLTATRRRVSDYSFYCDGGTYYGHPISIIKNNRSNKSKPRFNYYDTVTRNIMFDYEFFSAFPFENNKANAWATDGHKYELPSMLFIESKENNDIIIKNKQYNTMKNTRNRVRLTESQLHQVIKESVKKILSEVFLSPSDDEMAHLNMDKNTHVSDSYDTIEDSDGPYCMDDISPSEKSNVSITILKPFKYNQGSGSGSYDTSSSGEEVIILPNQTIELSVHNKKNWGAIHTWYQGMAKCAHRHTFYAHGRDPEYNLGVGNTKLVMRGYSTLINGEKKGFFRINQ